MIAARRAQAAYLRQELTSPAAALAEYAAGLAAKSPGLNAEDAETTRRLLDRALKLRQLVADVTAESPAESESGRDHWREVRHDLRAAAAFVVMACDDLLEGCPEAVRLEPELGRTRAAADQALELIESVVRFGQAGPGAEPLSESVRAMLDKLPRAAPPGATGRVLVVDDNEFGRDLLARALAAQGHAVEVAPGGGEALARLETAPPIDLILLDVMMPGLTGPEVLARLKADPRHWSLPVIMVSALGDDDGVLACIAAGAEDYLTRPVKPELLRARIAGGLEKKRLRDREAGYQARIDSLVRAIFPPAAVEEWQSTGTIRPRSHDNAGVLFLDVVGFTAYAERYRDDPAQVIRHLQELVERYESTAARRGVQKIKTIGDSFMGAVGLSAPCGDPARVLLECALDFVADTAGNPAGWQVRVGIEVGPVVTGVLGKSQFGFDVWGHTVNSASRTESNGTPGRVTLSAGAWESLGGAAEGEPREVAARGLGRVTVWDFVQWRG